MRPWQINILIVVSYFGLIFILPISYYKILMTVVIISSVIWVYNDAKKINIQKYNRDLLVGESPTACAVVVFFLWFIGMPLYISCRRKILDGKAVLKDEFIVPTPPQV